MAIFIFEYMSLKMRSAVFSFFGSFHYDREKKKSLDRKYVLLRRADVKQKCRRVSIMRKKSFFTTFKTSAVAG